MFVVRTRSGAVRGRSREGVHVYLGVPFAAPPVGARRFQAPAPAEPWAGVREADAFGPPPPQSAMGPSAPSATGPFSRHDPADWLTLNVCTPDPGAAGLPVMVYIHGGAYRFGTSGEYDGTALARRGAVVVTFNHRVGVEGYASLTGAPDNRALLDQRAALRWVRENIAAFGGDPHRVTVFGESAGAGAIAALLVMPDAASLFDRAIAHSVPGTFFTPALAADIAAELARPLGLPPSATALADVPPERLLEAIALLDGRMPERWGLVAHTPTPFSPVVDGHVLPVDPWTGLAAGAGRDIPLMAGHNRDEWRLFLALGEVPAGGITDELADTTLRVFGPGPDAEQRIRAAFPDADAETLYVTARSDRMFRIPTLRLAEAHTTGGGRSHLNELTWPSPAFGGTFGACHALDIPLVFGTFDGPMAFLLGTPVPEEAQHLSTEMQNAWLSFATTADPGWPPYNEQTRTTRIFDTPGTTAPYPEATSRHLWSDHPIPVLDLED